MAKTDIYDCVVNSVGNFSYVTFCPCRVGLTTLGILISKYTLAGDGPTTMTIMLDQLWVT